MKLETIDAVTELSKKYTDLKAELLTINGRDTVRLSAEEDHVTAPGAWVDYWKEENAQPDTDAWRYKLSHSFYPEHEYTGPYSHPAQEGCWIMAKRYLTDVGAIKTPADNSHLDEQTARMMKQAQERRDTIAKPVIGDIIEDKNGTRRRFCTPSYNGDDMQTTKNMRGSYYIGHHDGCGSYSGGCGGSIKMAELTRKGKEPARFWTFKRGHAGAGNGVDLFIDVTVWNWSGDFAEVWG
ncbi:hypothetical protein [uncultured Pelagimonas sp.]|uniref:hypothetical protein n=1 Tax=uncultured Pelagimonas sp. TaxID=1618102 RepID=UPI0026264249|nr:hypothetical protein [uncultured Pelagimonas sp.]